MNIGRHEIDERTKLTANNKLELLLCSDWVRPSSLTGGANEDYVKSVGADTYNAMFADAKYYRLPH